MLLRKTFIGRKYIMKKVLALTLALIMALSAAVTAFAATDNCTNTCPYCQKTFDKESEYNAHIKNTIPVKDHVKHCPYSGEGYKDGGCTAQFVLQAEYDKHLEVCPFKGTKELSTEEKIEQFFKNINWKEVGGKIVELLKKIPFQDLAKKLLDLLKKIPFQDIIDKITGLVK